MALIPCGHRILIKHDILEEVDETFKSAKAAGIHLPKEFKEIRLEQNAVDKGTVVGIGPTAWKDFGDTPWCNVGDYIAFAKHAGKYIEDPETKEEFVLLNDEDICAVIKNVKLPDM
jgi:co-chaperonin GroES (HSP10)